MRSCPTGYQTGSSLYRHCAWTMSMRIWLGDERLVRWLSGMPSTRASVEAYIRHCREQWVTGGPLRSFGIRTVAKTIVGTIDLRFDGEGWLAGRSTLPMGSTPAGEGVDSPLAQSIWCASMRPNTARPKR